MALESGKKRIFNWDFDLLLLLLLLFYEIQEIY
jgi:hypothetical protein